MSELQTGRQRFTKPYMWAVIAAGAGVFACALYNLPFRQLDFRFLLLFLLTALVSSRIAVKVPRANTTITVADTFVFLTLLLYGPHAAVIVAAADGLSSGSRISRRAVTILFNAAAIACAVFITGLVVQPLTGVGFVVTSEPYAAVVVLLCIAALAQYLSHTWLVAACLACKSDQPLWQTWSTHYLWSSLTYFMGAFLASGIIKLEGTIGFYAMLAPLPVILIIYLTYQKYLDDIRTTAAKAERAERERAEAERLRAEQAERHVEELNRYVEKLERAGRELRESQEHFRHAAFHDALTGLPNRTLFAEHIRAAIDRTRHASDYLFAVLFIDLDRFKIINDSLGHSYGDELLRAVARRLQHCLRPSDTVARFGGDEFAILLDGIKGPADAVRKAEKIQRTIAEPFMLNRHETFTTASVGVALSAPAYVEAEDLIRDADTAMYRAKDAGKARYEIFDTAMHTRAVTLLRTENDLRRALDKQEFCVHYQPIISISTGELHGFEALVRWRHPERGMIPPGVFIPLAEETGLILPLGLFVLREACRQARVWQQQQFAAGRNLTISVNLSGKQLAQTDLTEQIEKVLEETGLKARHLKLEITESAVMENAESATVTLGRLRALGVHLSIDDFGTGYSSLSYLHRFPVDTLKIDRSFVARMSQNDENLEIVRTVMTLARTLSMQVVAEGIETTEQLAQLKALKCEFGQGFLFSKPLEAADAEEFILKSAKSEEEQSADLNQEKASEIASANFVM